MEFWAAHSCFQTIPICLIDLNMCGHRAAVRRSGWKDGMVLFLLPIALGNTYVLYVKVILYIILLVPVLHRLLFCTISDDNV